MNEGPGPRPVRVGWVLVGCLLAATWIGLGAIHRGHHADSLIPVLVSLQRWTPFYWEQDRFGMLVPLLALPVRDPMANLLVQGILSVAGGLAVFALLAWFVVRDARAIMAATLASGSFVLLVPDPTRFDYLVTQPYGVGLTLALVGLLVAERGGPARVGAGLVLVLLGHWVNIAGAVYLGPLVVGRALLGVMADRGPIRDLAGELRGARGERSLRDLDVGRLAGVAVRWAWGLPAARSLGLLLVAYAAGRAAMTRVRGAFPTNTEGFPVADWPVSWRLLAGNSAAAFGPGGWPVVTAVAAAVGLVALGVRPGTRREAAGLIRGAGALALAGVVVFLVVGTRSWLAGNDWHYRYVEVAVVELALAGWLVAVAPVRGRVSGRVATWAAPVVLILASTARDGWPSPARVRADFDRRWGAMTADLVDAECTHLVGTYWTVWPGVFHGSLVLHERGIDRPLWGITARSAPTWGLALATVPRDRACVASARTESGPPVNLSGHDLDPLVEVEGRPTIRVFRPGPRPPGQHDPRQIRHLGND